MAIEIAASAAQAEPDARRSAIGALFDAAPWATLFLTAIACNAGEPGLALERLLRTIDAGVPIRNAAGANWAIPRAFGMMVLFDTCRAPMVADPRFPMLAARLGLTRFWIETDDWPDCAEAAPYDFRALCLAAEATAH
jgi:hypothetical protein